MTPAGIGLRTAGSVRARGPATWRAIWIVTVVLVAGCAAPAPSSRQPGPPQADHAGAIEPPADSTEVTGAIHADSAAPESAGPMDSRDLPGRSIEPERRPKPVAPRLDLESSVYFSLGSVDIDDAGWGVVRRHAEQLKSNPRLRVTLFGHTDHLGSREYNVALGQKRVAAVEKALRASGVPGRQIRKNSYGYEKATPSPCSTDACRQHLRRVELRYLN
jgi:outer membrane protein OmpA-like peptidoglycan-associated protein